MTFVRKVTRKVEAPRSYNRRGQRGDYVRKPRLRRTSAGHSSRSRGQTLAEFAIVVPVVLAILGAIIQFGMVFWAQNTLTQVVRDTGRWEATQQATPCSTGTSALGAQTEIIAGNSSLFGYSSGEFTSPTPYTSDAEVNAFNTANAMAVAWVHDSTESPAQACPPTSNEAVWHVTIKINQTVATFFPGMQFLPGLGTCDGSGCHITLSSTAQFRMEPAP
jgi:Flp pilus assembly protein TadG